MSASLLGSRRLGGRGARLGPTERALGVVAAGLLAAGVLVLVLPSGGAVAPAQFRLAAPPHVGADTLGRDAGPAAETALARPLFAPDRRAQAVESGPVLMPRLAGIIAGQDAPPKAIFAADGDAKPPVLGVGGRIGGHVIQAIGTGSVTLDDGSVLHPAFADADSGGTAAGGGSDSGPGSVTMPAPIPGSGSGGPLALSVTDLIKQGTAARRGAPPPR